MRADHLHRTLINALQISAHHRAEILLNGRCGFGKSTEVNTVETCHAQALKTMLGVVEIRWHSALAAHPAFEGDAHEVATQVV